MNFKDPKSSMDEIVTATKLTCQQIQAQPKPSMDEDRLICLKAQEKHSKWTLSRDYFVK